MTENQMTTTVEKPVCELEERPLPADFVQPEAHWARYIPGGYSKSRCLRLHGTPMMCAVLFLAGTAIMFFGYDASVMSQVNSNPDYLHLMGLEGGTSSDSAFIGGIVSIWFLGFAIGGLLVGFYADKIGRLRTIQLGCAWGFIGAALQTASYNVGMMMVARVIGGIGCGHLNTVVPIW
jgi:MFS family permease